MINEDGILLFGSRDLSDKEDHLYSYAAKGYHDIFLVYISELFRGKYPLPRYYIGTWPDNIRQELIPKALELIQTKEHQLIRIAENLR